MLTLEQTIAGCIIIASDPDTSAERRALALRLASDISERIEKRISRDATEDEMFTETFENILQNDGI